MIAPAIEMAKKGYELSERQAKSMADFADKFGVPPLPGWHLHGDGRLQGGELFNSLAATLACRRGPGATRRSGGPH